MRHQIHEIDARKKKLLEHMVQWNKHNVAVDNGVSKANRNREVLKLAMAMRNSARRVAAGLPDNTTSSSSLLLYSELSEDERVFVDRYKFKGEQSGHAIVQKWGAVAPPGGSRGQMDHHDMLVELPIGTTLQGVLG